MEENDEKGIFQEGNNIKVVEKTGRIRPGGIKNIEISI